ncbi:Murein DD-endopeptidase MepM and murein hydrolase activator NlpD, contain LysM domain [Arboricoccus pini]|uniref:Murein DD-endopeptidase MepM and murein hydrolase activator NlpD, contain LysM domain n=1 Tax=Arboricoccus pini TaxID=1963835 RepID=A0A212QPZ6_9PROT|nr:M23 family metallopeptidase [Arboricoccus pini]SNB61519.1 Murein DD-endopeptidase MepM and murein hydrolase activator NlpD, contain LysM domain [Arboricoccus pini]
MRTRHATSPQAGRLVGKPARLILVVQLLALLVGCTTYEPRTWSAAGGGAGSSDLYLVRAGDTIGTIAAAHGVAPERLIAVNALSDPDRILVGQALRIPGRAGGMVAARPAVSRAVPAAFKPASRPAPMSTPRTTASTATAPAVNPLPPASRPAFTRLQSEQVASAEAAPVRLTGRTRTAAAPTPVPVAPADSKALRKAAVTKPPPLSGEGFMWPANGKIVQTFGPKANGQRNDGINIGVPEGTPVVAAENGIVVFAGDSIAGFGNMLLIQHASGFTTAYAHNETLLVSIGQSVKRGQIIARSGATGAVTSPQLHFELRAGRKALDPTTQLTDRPPDQIASR